MSTSPAGWYPQSDGRQRYWDGQQWTEHYAPGASAQPGTPTAVGASSKSGRSWYAKKRFLIPAGLVALFVIIGALSGGGDEPTTAAVADSKPVAEAPASGAARTSPTAKAAAPKPAAKPAAPKPAPKPVSQVGKPLRDGKFGFTVRSVTCGIATVGENQFLREKAQGQFCAVQLTVENIGDEPQSMFADNQYAFDSKGRKFSANSMASLADESSQVLWEEVNPGNAVKGTVYFDVPKGAKLTSLELHDSMFSGGIRVHL